MNIKTLILIGTFALSLVIAYPMMSLAQSESEAGNQSSSGSGNQSSSGSGNQSSSGSGNQSSSGSQVEVPLNFTLKAKGAQKAKEGQENKSITVDVTVQQGEGGTPTKIPVTAEVPNNTKMQDVQLCSSMKQGKESCQSLKDFMPKQNQSSSGSSKKSSKDSSDTTNNG